MRFSLRSIRVRLTFWYTLLVLSTLVAFAVASYYNTGQKLTESLDRSLGNEVRWVQNFIQPRSSKVKPSRRSIDALLANKGKRIPAPQPAVLDSAARDSLAKIAPADEAADEIWNQIYEHTLLSPKKTYIQVADRKGVLLYRSYSLADDSIAVPDTLAEDASMLNTVYLRGEAVRVAAARDRNFTVVVGYPLAELREALENLYANSLLFIPIAFGISVIGGLFLAHRSLKPVDDVIRSARQITAENLDRTIPARPVNDEIGRLITTFNEMIRRLHDSFAQVKQFSGDASHELRTPLTVMRGEIEVALRSGKTPDQYREVLSSALEEIVRMTAILDNLMTLAKADQGIVDTHLSEVRLDELVQELYDDSEILAEPKDIRVSVEHTVPITIVGDRMKLRQLFLNLITNAIRYTPTGGRVTMAVSQDNGSATFAVRDTGIGIPAKELGKIFDRFYRVDKARSRELGGSGLGLSIAKLIAEQHRGSITVESEPDKGSTFTVHLPIN